MRGIQIEKLLLSELKSVQKKAEKVLPHFLPENIHAFRVSVKRMRAVLRLVSSDSEHKIKLSRKFRQVYHFSGFIREIQGEEKKLIGWNSKLPSYYRALQIEIAHYEHQWGKHYSKHLIKKLKQKILSDKFKSLDPVVVIKFYKTNLGILNSLYKNPISNEEIHTFRKHVKDMLYISDILKKKWKKAYVQIETFPLIQLEKLGVTIGNYNDERIILDHLLQFIPPTEIETDKLTELCSSLRLKQQKDRKKLFIEMKGFITSAKSWSINHQ